MIALMVALATGGAVGWGAWLFARGPNGRNAPFYVLVAMLGGALGWGTSVGVGKTGANINTHVSLVSVAAAVVGAALVLVVGILLRRWQHGTRTP